MKFKKVMALVLASVMTMSLAACGSDSGDSTSTALSSAPDSSAEQSSASADSSAASDAPADGVGGSSSEMVAFPEQLNNGEPCTIRFGWWGGQTRHDRTQQVVDMFMEMYPNVKIETEPADFDGYFQKLPTLIGANDVWDVFQLGNNWAEFTDIVTDLTPYIEDGTINTDYITDGFLSITYDLGKQMEISLGTNAHCIIYNADMLEDANLEEPAWNWTWEDYEKYAEALKEVTGEYGSSSLEEFYGACTVGIPQYGEGKNFFKGDNSGLLIESPDEMVPFIQMIQRMTASGAYPDRGALNEMGTSPEQNFVATGEAAMTWQLSNQVVAMAQAAAENQVGTLKIATLPRRTADGPSGYAVKSSQGLAIYTKTEYPDVCAAFINFFINSTEANMILAGERGVPISSAVRDALAPTLSEVDQQIYDYIGMVGAWEDSKNVFINEPSQQAEIKDEFNSTLDKVNAGSMSAEDAAQHVFDFANDAFSR